MVELHYIGATWCAPCKVAKPQVEALAKKYGLILTMFDYDEMEEEVKDTVKKLPTVRILEKGFPVKEITTQHADMLEMWLQANVRVNTTDDF
jgi:thiol-disulfide isomerase/thioredoxin